MNNDSVSGELNMERFLPEKEGCFVVAVVGATGAVGQTMLEILA